MTWTQLVTPDPDIACTPGYCLQYVRQAFNLPAHYASATEAWDASTTRHTDWVFPDGVWHPVWFAVDGVPEGHVVLRAPDGSVYSTTDAGTNVPHHHPDLGDLINHYARLGPALTYRGWTEDVAGTPVIESTTITTEGSILVPTFGPQDKVFTAIDNNPASLEDLLNSIDTKLTNLLATPLADPTDPGKAYTVADWLVWGATFAKHAAATPQTAVAPAAAEIAAHLQITTKP